MEEVIVRPDSTSPKKLGHTLSSISESFSLNTSESATTKLGVLDSVSSNSLFDDALTSTSSIKETVSKENLISKVCKIEMK